METHPPPPEEKEEEAALAALQQALDEGEASGIFERDAFESVWKKMGWSPEHQ